MKDEEEEKEREKKREKVKKDEGLLDLYFSKIFFENDEELRIAFMGY